MIKRLFLDDRFIILLILINSVILFFSGYFQEEDQKFFLNAIDHSITILFIIEFFFKFIEFGPKSYFNSNWNRLDFTLILLATPALISFFFRLEFLDFSYLLVFRILRVFKAIRFLKFIPDIEKLLAGVQRAMKASLFVLTGFIVYIFMIGILSFYLFQGTDSEYFKEPLIALYSTFKIFTIEGWFEIPENLTVNYSKAETFFTYLYFIFIVLTGGVFGLSIINSIFVDAMVSDNNDEIEKKIEVIDYKISEILTKLRENETRENTR